MPTNPEELKVVVIGGGTGSSAVLSGLKEYTTKVTAVVTMFDTGGSSGLLQDEFGYPPLGDLRQCLLSLSEHNEGSQSLRQLLDFRFRQESSLNGHSLGNLLLAALTTLGDDLELAIDEMARLLRIRGQVIPVTLERAELCAELEDGQVVRGESNIDLRRRSYPGIKLVYLRPSIQANPKAIRAILSADVVVLGPGDLYTSIIPNLLAGGIPEALANTQATRIYVCNLMTKLGETDGFKASDFVGEVIRYLGGPNLDWALIDNHQVSMTVQEVYLSEGAYPVVADLEVVRKDVPGVSGLLLGNDQVPMKHDPHRIAQAVLDITNVGRVRKTSTNGHGRRNAHRHTNPPLQDLPVV